MYDTLYITLRQPIFLDAIVDFFIYQHKALGDMLWILLLPIHNLITRDPARSPIPITSPDVTKSGTKETPYLSLDALEKNMMGTNLKALQHLDLKGESNLKLSSTVAKVLSQLYKHGTIATRQSL
jgi:hypothetical protein